MSFKASRRHKLDKVPCDGRLLGGHHRPVDATVRILLDETEWNVCVNCARLWALNLKAVAAELDAFITDVKEL